MSQRKKITIIILFLVSIMAVVFLISDRIKKSRISNDEKNFNQKINTDANVNDSNIVKKDDSAQTTEIKNTDEDENHLGEFLKEEDKTEEDETAEKEIGEEIKESFLEIDKYDCEDKCIKYEKNKEDYEYCQEICGLNEISNKTSPYECEDSEGLEEDYCLRDVAIKKLDYAICDKIEDAGVRKMCHNRITEELVDSNVED